MCVDDDSSVEVAGAPLYSFNRATSFAASIKTALVGRYALI